MERALRTDRAVLVSLAPGAPTPPALLARGVPLGAARRHWRVPVEGDDVVGAALRWSREPGVADALPDVWLPKTRAAAFDDPSYGSQWYLDLLGMDALYDETLGDPAVRVQVNDSAIQIHHPDLEAGVIAPLDTVDGDGDPSPVPGEDCTGGATGLCDVHGTAVSGIVGARANNGTDIVGMCPECTLVPVRMIGGPASSDVEAFEHALDTGAAVVNNSWGYDRAIGTPSALAEVMGRAYREGRDGLGTVIVFAAGNDDRKLEPSEVTNEPGVICVSATDRYHLPTAYTNRGRAVDVAAFSATVTISPDGAIDTAFGGTSAAAPVVAGLAGWILSYDPTMTADAVEELLVDTAYKNPTVTYDADGHHEVYGYGEISPETVLAALRGEWPPPATAGGDGEEPRGCGCDGSAGAAATPGILALAALVARRGRR